MIIPNGYIQIKIPRPNYEGIDNITGFPHKALEYYNKSLPAQIIKNSNNRIGVTNGEHFDVTQYIIYVEGNTDTAAQYLQLYINNKKIGNFLIKLAEYLPAVNQTKILV
jgi:hypothetical protein